MRHKTTAVSSHHAEFVGQDLRSRHIRPEGSDHMLLACPLRGGLPFHQDLVPEDIKAHLANEVERVVRCHS